MNEELQAQSRARAAAEASLAELKARLDAVESELKVRTDIMNETSIVSEADKKGDILSINEKFIEVSRYSREELIGQPHNTTRHPDMPKEVFKQMWSTIGRGQIFRGVVKNRAKDGTPYYVDAVIAPILGENGKPMKYLGVRYDITASEIERQNARGILAAIDTSYAYIEFDLGGHVLSVNDNFLKVMGYRSEEVVGHHHRMFVDPAEVNAPAYAQFWRDLNDGKPQNNVFRRVGKSGQDVLDTGRLRPGEGRDGPCGQDRQDRHRCHGRCGGPAHAARGGGARPEGDVRRDGWRPDPAHPDGGQERSDRRPVHRRQRADGNQLGDF